MLASMSLLQDLAGYLVFFLPHPRSSHFSREPLFLLLDKGIEKPRFGHQLFPVLLTDTASRCSQWTGQEFASRNVCFVGYSSMGFNNAQSNKFTSTVLHRTVLLPWGSHPSFFWFCLFQNVIKMVKIQYVDIGIWLFHLKYI